MRRPLWSRALAALFALWFTVYTVEPAALHACDVHDAAGTAAPAHDVHAEHSVATTDDAQSSGTTSCCTCPGDCATPPPGALPTAAITLAVVVTTATTNTGLPDYEYVPVASAHVLPFANGPPTRA